MVSYMAAVWRCRYFWLSLVKMDLRTRYRRSLLGVAWSLVHPLAMTAVLSLAFQRLVAEPVREYAPYVLAGLAVWNYLSAAILQGCSCFFEAESYIRQHPAPLAIYPLRATLGALIHFLAALLVVMLLGWYCKGPAALPALASLVPTLLLLFVLGWALAVLAGLATVYFHDVRHIAEIGLQIMFYATPVIYRASVLENSRLGWWTHFNPAAVFLEMIRAPIVGPDRGQPPGAPAAITFAIAGGVTLIAVLLASAALARLQRRLIFHL